MVEDEHVAEPKRLREYIGEARLALGLTQSEFSERVGSSQGTVGRWEKGDIPRPQYHRALADVLGMAVTDVAALADAERDDRRVASTPGVRVLSERQKRVLDLVEGWIEDSGGQWEEHQTQLWRAVLKGEGLLDD